jgi:hypothetical protein
MTPASARTCLLKMSREQLAQKRRAVHCSNRTIFWSATVEPAVQLVQLPVQVDRVSVYTVRLEAIDLTPPSTRIPLHDHQDEIGIVP